jgi:tRNA threonylcarbamoyl adenosine modification protein YeaZ
MKILALDSSGLVASVAIIADGTLLAEYTVNYKKTHSQTLLPMLDEISNMIELDLGEVDAVAVAAGPGSFTGLRIGSATAKGLGLALGIPIIEVPTLAGLAYNLFDARGLIVPCMDARRKQVYNGIYRFEDHKLVTVRDQRPIAAADLIDELCSMDPELTRDGVIFLGDGVPVIAEESERLSVPFIFAPAHVGRQKASSVGALALVLYAEGRYVKAEEHAPIYLRKSQAEQERERRMAGKDSQ